ncbi:unnamed protein product [Spirodela intermedia]|uniref:Uncharacterized protein n=1 Tax=Spirodela intermedia TaxID=51605 RepID=A0A7I8IAM5_SPIIN|nr:unnamed protein product [Spirodela intermedia]CAA6654640.1 unnamed protein product [Spirodela intermedia]
MRPYAKKSEASACCIWIVRESYMKNCKAEGWVEIGRAAFEFWANMSPKVERHPFVKQAEHVNSAYLNKLLEEAVV